MPNWTRRPGPQYRIDPNDRQGSMGRTSPADAMLNSLGGHGFESPISDVPTVADAEETDLALQLWGHPRRLR